MLCFFAMQIRCAWLWPECCFWSVSQVHYLMQIHKCINTWSNFPFLHLQFLSLLYFTCSLTVALVAYTIGLNCFLSQSMFVVLKVSHQTTSIIHAIILLVNSPSLSSCLQKHYPVPHYDNSVLSTLNSLPIRKYTLNPTHHSPFPVAQNWLRMTGSFLAAPIQHWSLGSRSWRRSWLKLGGSTSTGPRSWHFHPSEVCR